MMPISERNITVERTATAVGTMATEFRKVRLPLVAYYAVTVVVPLANGSGNTSREFLEHMAFVVLAPATLVVLFAFLSRLCRRAAR